MENLINIHLLSGFLGSGKTTAIQSACHILQESGMKVAVITNDQGIKLVDADLFRHLGIPGRQVMNGCFCCNYPDLDNQIQSLMEAGSPDVIFAESVGSCTDIIATVLKPLRLYRPSACVTLSVFADALLLHMLLVEGNVLFEESVNYIYFKQLEESTILIINKVDLLEPVQLYDLKKALAAKYGNKVLLYQNSKDYGSARQWINALNEMPFTAADSLEMDYDLYGEGEARLAWLDQEIEIESDGKTANRIAVDLMMNIHHKITNHQYPIGHLKFLLNGKEKVSFTSNAVAEEQAFKVAPAESATVLLNARVQTGPAELSELVEESIREAKEEPGTRIRIRSVSAFQPGYPKPTHRLA